MSVYTAFQFENGEFVAVDRPWASGLTWRDILDHEHFRKDVSMALGRPHGGLRVEIHEAEDPSQPYQEFTFLALVRLGETAHPIFCRDLPNLLQFLQQIVPLIELDLKCTSEVAGLQQLPGLGDLRPAQESEYRKRPRSHDTENR